MERKWDPGIKIFKTLKRILQVAIEGRKDFIVEIDQKDTYYLTRLHKAPQSGSYFASVQIRIDGVYLQLHTFLKPPSFDKQLFPKELKPHVDPGTRSLVFTRSSTDSGVELLEVVMKALRSR